MSSTRRRFTVDQKATVVRRHLADKTPVSDLADGFNIQPSQIHAWVKQVREHMPIGKGNTMTVRINSGGIARSRN